MEVTYIAKEKENTKGCVSKRGFMDVKPLAQEQ